MLNEPIKDREKLLNISQAAELLNVSKWKIRQLTGQGTLKTIIISKRGDRRFRKADIEEFIKKAL